MYLCFLTFVPFLGRIVDDSLELVERVLDGRPVLLLAVHGVVGLTERGQVPQQTRLGVQPDDHQAVFL